MARKAGITRDRVVEAAAAIADRDGLAAVSLATVAEAVGVRSPSLYSHVDGIDGLRRGLGRRAARQLAERLAAAAEDQTDPGAALRAIAHAYRSFARDHPGLYATLLPAPRPDEDPDGAAAAAEGVRVVAAVLDRLGIAPDRHIDLIRTLRAMLHGFVDLELGHGFGLADPVDASFEAAVDLVVAAVTTPTAAA
jgi:AcrR family transcriptional regulator